MLKKLTTEEKNSEFWNFFFENVRKRVKKMLSTKKIPNPGKIQTSLKIGRNKKMTGKY